MASIATEPNGHRRILFTAPDGRRKTLRLGKLPKKDAEALRVKVESLLTSRVTGQPVEPETARWVAALQTTGNDVLHDKLAAVGLVEARSAATLGPFLRDWLTLRKVGVKHGTTLPRVQAVDTALQFWPEHTPADRITYAEVERFDVWMRFEREPALSAATAAKRCQVLQRAWAHGVKAGKLTGNPFADADVRTSVSTNINRHCYVAAADIRRVLDELPTAEWRALVALARFAGVRVPSEPTQLKWTDIDWAARSIRIESPKTAHLPGRGERHCPLLPELEPYLRDAFEQADDGAVYVFPMLHRSVSPQVLRKPMQAALRRAGLTPWPKLFHALRASAQTDLAGRYPLASVCRWLGNTPAVAAVHYLQPRDEDFTRAAASGAYADPPKTVARNPAQYTPAPGRTTAPDPRLQRSEPHSAAPNNYLMIPTGFEPVLPG